MQKKIKSDVLSKRAKQTVMTDLETIDKIFEYYFDMGPERSLLNLSKKVGYAFEIIKEWSSVYAWDEKINERNKELDRSFENYYKHKSRDIRNRLVRQMENLLGEMESCSLGLPFHVKDVQDFRQLSQAYESLVRANTMAMTKGVEVGNNDAPTTWADLLQAAAGQDNTPKLEDSEEV